MEAPECLIYVNIFLSFTHPKYISKLVTCFTCQEFRRFGEVILRTKPWKNNGRNAET